MQFIVPGTQARAQALGPLEYLPPVAQRLLSPSDFEPIHAPGPNDGFPCTRKADRAMQNFCNRVPTILIRHTPLFIFNHSIFFPLTLLP